MTEQETVKIVTLIVMSYPASDKLKDENTVKAMSAVWANVFRDDAYRLVELAVMKHISLSKWPPSVAEIREIMTDIMHPEIIPPDEAWAAVSDLLYAGNEFGGESAYSCLPPLVKRTVDIIGWGSLCRLHGEGVRGGKEGLDRVAFLEQYKPAYARERENMSLPKHVSKACESAKQSLGAETQRQIDAAYNARREFDEMILKLSQASCKGLMEGDAYDSGRNLPNPYEN